MPLASADTSRFLFSAAGTDFLVTAFTAEEQISRLFSADVELAAHDEIDPDAVKRKPSSTPHGNKSLMMKSPAPCH